MSIAESKVLPWVVDEVARLSPHKTAAELGTEEHEAERAELEVRRARVVDAYLDGTIDKARRDSELAAIDGQLDRLDAVTPSVIRPIPKRIAWDRDPAIVNKALRAIIATIELDGAMLPVRADWHVPEWRSAEVAAA